MAPPRRIDEFEHREFHVILARDGDLFRALARDARGQQVLDVSDQSLDAVKAEIKYQLNQISQNFIGIDGAMNLFRRAFPEGFASQRYKQWERDYKDATVAFMADRLGESHLRRLLADGDYDAIGASARKAMSGRGSLCFANEQMALGDALRSRGVARPFAESLCELLYGDFESALEDLARLLKPYNAAKWPVLTFWPFFRFPERHMFLKPTVVQDCAERMGFELRYASMPNRDTYRSLLEFAQFLRNGLAALEPQDNIDLQSFMYVVATEGYVRDVMAEREADAEPHA